MLALLLCPLRAHIRDAHCVKGCTPRGFDAVAQTQAVLVAL
jgi:hypothetical protein